MCGDVGFAELLFQCSRCRSRFQHRYCSRGYFYGDHIELCDWCFVESDQSGGSTISKPALTKNVDGKKSNASNSLKRKVEEANAFSLKRKGDEIRFTVKCNDRKANVAAGLMRSVTKTTVQSSRFAPPRNRQRMKLLHEILC